MVPGTRFYDDNRLRPDTLHRNLADGCVSVSADLVQNLHRQTLYRQVVSSSSDLLFVYGTLMRTNNGAMHPLLISQAEFVGTGSIPGKLYQIQDYPGAVLTDGTQHRVFGEVYRLLATESTLLILDAYEECTPDFPKPHEYTRIQLPVAMTATQSLTAWVYLYNLPTEQLKQISSGNYRNYLSMSL